MISVCQSVMKEDLGLKKIFRKLLDQVSLSLVVEISVRFRQTEAIVSVCV